MSEIHQISNSNDIYKRKFLSISLSIFFTIIYLILIIIFIKNVYKPDIKSIIDTFYNTYSKNIWNEELHFAVTPEPIENMQFISCLILLPVLLASFYWIFNLLFNQLKKPLINILFYSISIFQILALLFIIYFTSKNSNHLFAFFMFGKYSLWIYTVVIFPLLLLVLFLYNKYLYLKRTINIINLIIIGIILSAIFSMNIFNTNVYWGYILHFNALIYTLSQVAVGKTLLVDFISSYGLYPHFLNPLFSIIGLSVLKFSIVMSSLNIITFLLIFIAIYKLVQNKFILFLGFCTLIFLNYFVHRCLFYPDVYFQYFPIRVIFPALLIFISTYYIKSFHKAIYYSSFPLFSIGILWNMDIGLIVFISWILLLSFIEFSKSISLKIRIINITKHILVSIVLFATTIIIFCLWMYSRSGHFPDFVKLLQYQQIFYNSGFNASPLPVFNEWNIIILIYIYGLAISLKSLIDKTNDTYYSTVFLLSILGFGLFSYYQCESQLSRLSQVSYPAILLLILYINKILSGISKNRQINFNNASSFFIFIILFFFLSSGIYSIIINGSMIKNDAIAGFKSINNQDSNSDISKNIAFIIKHSQPGEKILILSNHYEGLYYAESHTMYVLNIPSSDELLLKEDFNKIINKIVNNESSKIFVDLNTKGDDFKKLLIQNNYGVIADVTFKFVGLKMVSRDFFKNYLLHE